MKKLLISFFLLLTSVVCRAYDFEVGGIYYEITSDGEHTVAVAYGSNKYVGSVAIPESIVYDGITYSVTAIDKYAFSGSSGLTSIAIPNSVTKIGKHAFFGCGNLTSVTIGNSVTAIGEEAFCNCSGLISIIVDTGNPVYDSRDNCNAIIRTSSNALAYGCKNTIIPNSVTIIGAKAFSGCSSLTSITIPNSVTKIRYNAFSSCSYLTSVTIGNSVTKIGENAFSGCSRLTSVNIPSSVTTISESVFSFCSSLESIVVDAGNPIYDSRNNCNAIIKTLSNTLIQGCKNTIIPNGVTTIGDWAFEGCSGLTSMSIPNSVTTIGEYAFYNCNDLTSVTIGNSVTTIGEGAFSFYGTLKDFYCYAENVPTANNAFSYSVKLFSATLHVPEASLQKYGSREPWNRFGHIVALTESDGIKPLASEENRPTTVYSLDGRRVAKPRKGIYVIGGRKTAVR